jgi:glycosyltransferase involved in cell wall biosynthesis
MKLGLSIPLFNEADGVTEVVVSIHAVLDNAGIDAHIVLVNNGSDDATGDRIEALRTPGIIETVHLRENAGYGGGICAGLAKLEQGPPPDVIGWCWGDGQVSATALPPLFEAICAGADVAKAVRTRRLDGIKRQVISTSYAATMKLLGVNTPDVNGCPKLMSWAAFQAIAPRRQDWFLDAELILKAERLGLNIVDHPVTMRPRTRGQSKVNLATIGEFVVNIGRWRLGGQS